MINKKYPIIITVFLFMLILPAVLALEASDTHVVRTIADPEVYIVSDIGDEKLTDRNKPQDLDGKSPFDNQNVTILAIIKEKVGKNEYYYTDPNYVGTEKGKYGM